MARGLTTAIALLGAGMGGYARGKRDRIEELDAKDRMADRKADREFQAGQRARMTKLQGDDDAERTELQAAGTTATSPAAAARAQADVKTRRGKPQEAQQLHDFADRMDSEGALKFIDENIRDLKDPGEEFALKGLDAFNAAGKYKAPPGAKGRSTRIKLPNGQEVNDFEVVDADGKVILPSARRIEALYGYSRAERDRMEREGFSAGRAAQHQADTLTEQKRAHMANEGIAQQNANTQAGYRRDQAAARMADATKPAAEPTVVTAESTFDSKTAAEIAKDTVKREAEESAINGKPMTGAQIAKRTDEITNALFVQHQNRFVMTQVQRTLAMAQGDPAAYAQQYGKAMKLIPQAELARMGFPPPAQPAPAQVPRPAPGATPAAPPAAAQPVAPLPAAAPAPMATMGGTGNDKVLQGMQAEHMQALGQLAQAVKLAEQQLMALGKSGDPQAIARQGQIVAQARDTLQAEAAKRLGNNADRYLSSLR